MAASGFIIAEKLRGNEAATVEARPHFGLDTEQIIPEDVWIPIPYWLDGGADVAETTYTAFKKTKDQVTLRLIVRRVRPTPGSEARAGCGVRLPRHSHSPDRRHLGRPPCDIVDHMADYLTLWRHSAASR